VGATIAARDHGDAEQLVAAPDAHVIDTSGLTAAEVVERVVALVEAAA
jgi:cytidylate kinase